MNITAQLLLATESACQSGYRSVQYSRLSSLPALRPGTLHLRFATFATYPPRRRRRLAPMASDPLNPSDSDGGDKNSRSISRGREGTPFASRAAAGATAASSLFPMGYREGFSQWVSRRGFAHYTFRCPTEVRLF